MDLSQILEQASKLKSAQLAQMRKEYESSPGFIKATAEYASRNNEWRDLSISEKIHKCESFKKKGNEHFNKKDYMNALSSYSQGISIFRYFEKKDEKGEKLELKDHIISGYSASVSFWTGQEMFDKAKSLIIALLTNCATVALATRKHVDVIWCCKAVSKYDEKNIKALYRMCQSHEKLDTTFDLQSALKYIKKAKAINSGNKAIISKYNHIKKLLKDQNAKDKKRFAGMFEKGSPLYQDKMSTEKRVAGSTVNKKPTCWDTVVAYSNCIVM